MMHLEQTLDLCSAAAIPRCQTMGKLLNALDKAMKNLDGIKGTVYSQLSQLYYDKPVLLEIPASIQP